MASLTREDGTRVDEPRAILAELLPLGVRLELWPVEADEPANDGAELDRLLARDALDDAEKERALALVDARFAELRQRDGWRARDLVVLHPRTEGLDETCAPFLEPHTHDDPEARWIVDGEGVFGFVLPDGSQCELEVERADAIHVPAGVEHWFRLTDARRIKAVRYFSDTAGWTPRYTGTPRRVP